MSQLPDGMKTDDLRSPEVAQLLEEHLEHMAEMSPPESIHALDLDSLKKPEITFWSLWKEPESHHPQLMGCGALKQLTLEHGEIKSMRTSEQHRRKGVAATLLKHIIQEATERGYKRLSLETGSMDGFLPAIKMYQKFGFTECEPFADYNLDPYSIFMTKLL